LVKAGDEDVLERRRKWPDAGDGQPGGGELRGQLIAGRPCRHSPSEHALRSPNICTPATPGTRFNTSEARRWSETMTLEQRAGQRGAKRVRPIEGEQASFVQQRHAGAALPA